MNTNEICGAWTRGDPILEKYHNEEWCKINHDDTYLFEMLSLEGASVGLSWQIILHKRDAYRAAFHQFQIECCAHMSDDALLACLDNPNLIRNRAKIFSVRSNAQNVLQIQSEFGSFDAYLYAFAGAPIDHRCRVLSDVPTSSELSIRLSGDMKRRGFRYVGPVITYSFLQAVGMVNDHLVSCPCR